jgi:hypothetical protein
MFSIANYRQLLLLLLVAVLSTCYLELAIQRHDLKALGGGGEPVTCVTLEMDKQLQETAKKHEEEKGKRKAKPSSDEDEEES